MTGYDPLPPCVICKRPITEADDEHEHEVVDDQWIGYHCVEHCAEAQVRAAVDDPPPQED